MKNMANRQLHFLHLCILLMFSHFICILSQKFDYSVTSQCMVRNCMSMSDKIAPSKSRIECAVKCSTNSTCVGFVYNGAGNCVHIQNGCLFNTVCRNSDIPEKVYEKLQNYCKNSGNWDSKAQKCGCSNGWVGERCERRAYKCTELVTYGYQLGVYRISIDVYRNQTRLVYTQCNLQEYLTQTIIFTNNGQENQNKTWNEYLHGYDIGEWNIWLGLENVLAFNKMGQEKMSVYFVVQPNNNYVWEYNYTNFRMEEARNGFSFTCDYLHNATNNKKKMIQEFSFGDIVAASKGLRFSTWDTDQDIDSKNCAAMYGAGWWIELCPPNQFLNPLGRNWMSTNPRDDQLWLPGIDINNDEMSGNFQSVLMVFTD